MSSTEQNYDDYLTVIQNVIIKCKTFNIFCIKQYQQSLQQIKHDGNNKYNICQSILNRMICTFPNEYQQISSYSACVDNGKKKLTPH